VNAICPGYTDTDIVRDAVSTIVSQTGRSVEEARAALVRTNPQRRLIQRRKLRKQPYGYAGRTQRASPANVSPLPAGK